MENELKEQLKVCYAALAALERPTTVTVYNRNEGNTKVKRNKLEKQIEKIKQQIKELQ